MSRSPLGFRDPTVVVALLGYVYDADEPVPWEEILGTFGSDARSWKTLENVIYELVAFGALHRTGSVLKRVDSRALRPTALGRAWLDRELLALPGQLEALGEADEIARRLEADADLDDVVHTLEPGSET